MKSSRTVRPTQTENRVDRKRSLAAKKGAVTRAKNKVIAEKQQLRLHHKLVAGGLIAGVVVLAFFGIRSQLQTYAATTNGSAVIGLGGKCLDNDHSIAKNGNRIQLWACNGNNSQKWTLASDGSLISGNGGGAYCLDIPNSNKAEYTYPQLWKCNGTNAQKFAISGKYLQSKLTSFCLTVRYAATDNGTRVWFKTCRGTDAQFWKYAGGSSSVGSTTTPSAVIPIGTSGPTPSKTYDLAPMIKATASGKVLALGTGYYTFSNFNNNAGITMQNGGGITGSATSSTIIQMTSRTSTRASDVPSQSANYTISSAKTNSLYLAKFTGGAPVLKDLTFKGTDQGHLYNGLKIDHTTGAVISDVKVSAIPGNADVPPGETFSISDASANKSVYKNVEVDGAGVGASLFAANGANNVTVTDSYFHDSPYGNGAAFWQTGGTNVITNTRSVNNKDFGFNFERQSGSVILTNTNTCGNKQGDYRMASDQTSATFKIVNPVYCGSKIKIKVNAKYNGGTDKQKRSDVKVIINGVDKTNDLVEWVS